MTSEFLIPIDVNQMESLSEDPAFRKFIWNYDNYGIESLDEFLSLVDEDIRWLEVSRVIELAIPNELDRQIYINTLIHSKFSSGERLRAADPLELQTLGVKPFHARKLTRVLKNEDISPDDIFTTTKSLQQKYSRPAEGAARTPVVWKLGTPFVQGQVFRILV